LVKRPPAACPTERFQDLPTAQAALVERRARAALSGTPHTVDRQAWPCDRCEGAHITRTEHARAA
jgi:hypothetical protein